MSRCGSFIKRVCLCTWSGGHCDTVWYVESYKQLALNSICKINSPRAGATHISLLPSSRPRFLPPFLVCLSSCSFSSSPFQSGLCSVLPVLPSSYSILHSPAHSFPGYYWPDWSLCSDRCGGSWSSWGSPSSGYKVSTERSKVRFWSDGCIWHHPQGTCMCERPHIGPYITWPVFAPTSSLSLCHPSPSCRNKAPVCVDLRFSFKPACSAAKFSLLYLD